LLGFALAACVNTGKAAENIFPSFADAKTVGLWLFDETQYPHTTLTDASKYHYDLRLQQDGRLVSGRFGNALKIASGSEHAVSFAGFVGAVTNDYMRPGDGTPCGLWGPTQGPERILRTLAGGKWTCEFWLRLSAVPRSDTVVIDLGQAYEPGFTLRLLAAALAFELDNHYAGFCAACPTNIDTGRWNHVAFTWDGSTARHFVNGLEQPTSSASTVTRQPLPNLQKPKNRGHEHRGFSASRGLEWRRRRRFNFTIGHDRKGGKGLKIMIDELRISDVVRYESPFVVPVSFSRNFGPHAPGPSVANGPPLLFSPHSPKGVVKLGSRKHLFIDAAIIDKMENVELVCNSPTDRRNLNFGPEHSEWRPAVLDKDGKVYMYIPEGYSSKSGITRLRISEDGVNFTSPKLGVVEFEGCRDNDYVIADAPLHGVFFEDLNPNVSPEERYKATVWLANRGIYLYMSPDAIHWRRNETCMLPVVSGGGAETFWDDQRGVYVAFLKRDSSYHSQEYPGRGRRSCMFETSQVRKTWPFKALKKPQFEGWSIPVVTGEGPVRLAPNKHGEVYRTRAIKYPWALDTYLAFVWRLYKPDMHRKVDLGVSRDGIHWNFCADKSWYMSPGDDEEVIAFYGLIRRGEEIWQYFDFGGAHGSGKRTFARCTQRLDGFVSVDTGDEKSLVVTRPLTFDGDRLVLNINAKGWTRVALLDEAGSTLPDFALEDCDTISGDYTRKTATWNGNADLSQYCGRTVRLKFEMRDAKLYALQFD